MVKIQAIILFYNKITDWFSYRYLLQMFYHKDNNNNNKSDNNNHNDNDNSSN